MVRTDYRSEFERAVIEAARDERKARAELLRSPKPYDRNWRDEEREAYELRVSRWTTASRAVVAALERLKRG